MLDDYFCYFKLFVLKLISKFIFLFLDEIVCLDGSLKIVGLPWNDRWKDEKSAEFQQMANALEEKVIIK